MLSRAYLDDLPIAALKSRCDSTNVGTPLGSHTEGRAFTHGSKNIVICLLFRQTSRYFDVSQSREMHPSLQSDKPLESQNASERQYDSIHTSVYAKISTSSKTCTGNPARSCFRHPSSTISTTSIRVFGQLSYTSTR